MKKFLVILLVLSGLVKPLLAAHIRGGELYYKYEGDGTAPNTSKYTITLKLYVDCNARGEQLDPDAPITIFSKTTGGYTQIKNFRVTLSTSSRISYDPASNPCISNPPTDVCYLLRYYETTVELPNTQLGYTVSYQRCCRIQGIVNMAAPSNDYGSTYMCEIPGTIAGVSPESYKNSSPLFNPNDAVAICYGSPFTFDFSAQDPEKDSIDYQLCNAYAGGGPGMNGSNCATCAQPDPATSPPYSSIPYTAPYSASLPLGMKVSINSATGLISGTAPSVEGQYVVTVCAYEYRSGKLINIHRKDIHIRVSDCIPLKASLDPDLSFCDDLNVTFKNKQVNPAGSVYIWFYGDGTKNDTITNLEGLVQHQYADSGTYNVKLKVVLAGQCVDSTTTRARVYPGFTPNFSVVGTCILLPIQFVDKTFAKYGIVNKWTWDFGDETSTADISTVQNPSWKYSTIGMKNVRLIVQSNKGCIDTVTLPADVRDKPPIVLAFKDTLICGNALVQDTLQLKASGNGIFSWSPVVTIQRQNDPDPSVYPKTTTVYHVQLNENGCVSEDSVRVRVVPVVSLNAGSPLTICLTDTVQLNPITDGLKFTWTTNPSPSPISDTKVKRPYVAPTDVSTTYTVLAEIGKCSAMDNVSIRTVPYPTARAGADTTICYDDTASLHASMIAARFTWTPVSTLSNPNILNPLAWPRVTTSYILRVQDDLGCPKYVYDTVKVTVLPEIFAFAGNDTSIVIGQPLQLNATGAALFEWTPGTYLNRNNIADPVANLNDNFAYQLKAYTPEGCFDLDTINIKVFLTKPDIFVPNAFRPDGYKNNVLRPILAGISRLEYFRIYNRWGQLVYQTTQHAAGWDGKLGGKPQDTGMYVWAVSGKDYTGKTVTKKGTAVLLR